MSLTPWVCVCVTHSLCVCMSLTPCVCVCHSLCVCVDPLCLRLGGGGGVVSVCIHAVIVWFACCHTHYITITQKYRGMHLPYLGLPLNALLLMKRVMTWGSMHLEHIFIFCVCFCPSISSCRPCGVAPSSRRAGTPPNSTVQCHTHTASALHPRQTLSLNTRGCNTALRRP